VAGKSRTDLYDPIASYNPYDPTALKALLPQFSFSSYFSGLNIRPAYPNPVIVAAPSYFQNLSVVLRDASESVLE